MCIEVCDSILFRGHLIISLPGNSTVAKMRTVHQFVKNVSWKSAPEEFWCNVTSHLSLALRRKRLHFMQALDALWPVIPDPGCNVSQIPLVIIASDDLRCKYHND